MSLTKEQRAAISRANGAKSRGPKTPEGKAISSRNALKTGLTAKKFIIPELESEQEFRRFAIYMRDHYRPINIMEALHVDRATTIMWRMRRINLEMTLRATEHNESRKFTKTTTYCGSLDELEKLTIIEERLGRQLQQTIKELDKLQGNRTAKPSMQPVKESVAVLIDGDSFGGKYED